MIHSLQPVTYPHVANQTFSALFLAPSSRLEIRHLQDWLDSGIDELTVRELGVKTSLSGDSWVIPFWDIDKTEILSFRAKFDPEVVKSNKYPSRKKGSRTPKYISSSEFGNRFFYPHLKDVDWKRIAQDINMPIFITEGEKKATKLTVEGYPSIGLTGTDCWVRRRKFMHEGTTRIFSKTVPIDDFNLLKWKDRLVYLVFDADKYGNENVLRSEALLLRYLKNELSADCRVVNLPFDPHCKGIDDFFVKHGEHAKEEFERLIY